jgi:hypothetical protein
MGRQYDDPSLSKYTWAEERMIVNNQNPNLGPIFSHSSLLRLARPLLENNRDHHDWRLNMP